MKVEMPAGQGDLDDDRTQKAAQSGAGCAKAARCRRDAQLWEGSSGGAAGAGSEREHVLSLAKPVRRDESRRGGAAREVGGREQAPEAVGGGPGVRYPDAEVRSRGK